MRQTLKGSAVHFAQEDLRAMINPDTIERIKLTDPSPEFRAYVIAGEGDVDGLVVGGERRMFRYVREAVQKVSEVLRYGTAAFYRHEGNRGDGDNAHRQKIGELVGHALREIGGKLKAIATFYIYPGMYRDKDLRAASIETNIEYVQDGEDVRVVGVDAVTGVALSDVDSPGFPGATLLAAMQAFAEDPAESGADMSDPKHNSLIPRDEEPPDNRHIPKVEPVLTMKDLRESIDQEGEERERRAREENPLIP